MSQKPTSCHVLIAPGVDVVSLFRRAQELFASTLAIERVVAASEERALLVARDKVLKRRVALRVHLLPGTRSRAWFERESELLAAIDHPGIRAVYSAGESEGWAFRISKWIDGESLLEVVSRGPRPIPAVVQLARDLLGVLEYVHAQRLVLRRIVPSTVMLDLTDRAIITDLRFANACLDLASPEPDPLAIAFLAPEVRGNLPGDPGSDIYAAGALLYLAVTGQRPAEEPEAIVAPRVLRPTCPQAVERIILRAVKRNPQDRYLTAHEMGEDLLSDLGDYVFQATVKSPLTISPAEDPKMWEKRLRRALGDDYELLRELGVGGFGRVYLVRDLALEREVALKVLHPYLTSDPEVVERFRREAQLAAQLQHPNIVSIYEIGGRAGLQWYTMAYVKGKSLARLVSEQGPLPVGAAVRLLRESLSALEHAHSLGVIHRDLKPENILIEDATGSVKITDFGLAIALHGPGRYGGASSHSGTPEFAAPEQLLGGRVDHRADLYSLACVAFYALCGRTPFGGGTAEAILARQTAGRLRNLRKEREDLPDDLLAVLERAVARDPGDRFLSAAAFRQALDGALQPWWSRPVRWLGRMLADREFSHERDKRE